MPELLQETTAPSTPTPSPPVISAETREQRRRLSALAEPNKSAEERKKRRRDAAPRDREEKRKLHAERQTKTHGERPNDV